jgi:hypothetical protein
LVMSCLHWFYFYNVHACRFSFVLMPYKKMPQHWLYIQSLTQFRSVQSLVESGYIRLPALHFTPCRATSFEPTKNGSFRGPSRREEPEPRNQKTISPTSPSCNECRFQCCNLTTDTRQSRLIFVIHKKKSLRKLQEGAYIEDFRGNGWRA